MKNLLKRIKKKSEDQRDDKKKNREELNSLTDLSQSYLTDTFMLRSSSSISTCSSAGSPILSDICIICDKKNKYVKKKQKHLRQYVVKQTQKTLENFANERNDFRMQSLVATSDMIAAEAIYHPSCYAEYTRLKNKKQTQSPEVTESKHCELEAFQIGVANCHEMICKQTILKLQNLTSIMKDHLHKNGLEATSSTKKNLRRNIENTFGNDIRKKIWQMNYRGHPNLLTSSQKSSTYQDTYLNEFLKSLLGGKDDLALSSRNVKIKYSMAQDIVYNLNSGRVKTPKSVLLSNVIKADQ